MDPTKSPAEGAVNFGGKMGEFDSMPKMDLGSHFIFAKFSPLGHQKIGNLRFFSVIRQKENVDFLKKIAKISKPQN